MYYWQGTDFESSHSVNWERGNRKTEVWNQGEWTVSPSIKKEKEIFSGFPTVDLGVISIPPSSP